MHVPNYIFAYIFQPASSVRFQTHSCADHQSCCHDWRAQISCLVITTIVYVFATSLHFALNSAHVHPCFYMLCKLHVSQYYSQEIWNTQSMACKYCTSRKLVLCQRQAPVSHPGSVLSALHESLHSERSCRTCKCLFVRPFWQISCGSGQLAVSSHTHRTASR